MLRTLPQNLLVVGLAVTLMVGCSLPVGDQSDPEQLHYKFISVRAAGDVDAMWTLLHPDVRAEFEQWWTAEKLAYGEIQTAYPKADVPAALKAIGGGKRAKLAGPKALFQMVYIARASPLGGLQEMGAHVRSSDVDGDHAVVRSYAGDETSYRKSGAAWFVDLPKAEFVRLVAARKKAQANRIQVQKNLNPAP
ncbi:MAG: hypothetical protein ACI9MR_003617 [Myxococcota bacterium]|jgi:hypothetical protein